MKKLAAWGAALGLVFVTLGCSNRLQGEKTKEPDSTFTFQATIIEAADAFVLVEPVEDSLERNSADRIEISTKNAEIAFEPEAGDMIEIAYDGNIAETYPAQISNVYCIKMIQRIEKRDAIPMVMIDDTVYLATGQESTVDGRCGVMDGEITSSVPETEKPTENNQSNFGTGYGYQYGIDGTIEIYMDGTWWIYAAEEAE